MKQTVMLTITSLLSILFLTFHLTDDILFGMSPGGETNMFAVLILVAFLYGTLVLADRRSGYVIILLESLAASGMPVLHMRGAGIGKHGFFFAWTLLALGVTGIFSFILSVRGLWSLRQGQSR